MDDRVSIWLKTNCSHGDMKVNSLLAPRQGCRRTDRLGAGLELPMFPLIPAWATLRGCEASDLC